MKEGMVTLWATHHQPVHSGGQGRKWVIKAKVDVDLKWAKGAAQVTPSNSVSRCCGSTGTAHASPGPASACLPHLCC